MGSTADKAAGLADEPIGNLKQGLGRAVGFDRLQVEGAAVEGPARAARGGAQQAAGAKPGQR